VVLGSTFEDSTMQQRFGKQSAAAQRAADRRERENAAPRLSEEVTDLENLKLEIEERSDAASVSAPKYIRRIQVQSAPALFLIPCGDSNCRDGGHDITHVVMHALHQHRTNFSGTDSCSGSLGSSTCQRVLMFEGFAEFKAK
jgi:hypothetical protein